jgi:hypothetical protein
MTDETDYQVIDRVSRETAKHLQNTDAVTAWDPEYEQALVLEATEDE